MDIRRAIRRDAMGVLLRAFVRRANEMEASPEEAAAALLDMSATIYAVRLSGAVTEKERRRAKRAFIERCERAVEALPMRDHDDAIEARLKAEGF